MFALRLVPRQAPRTLSFHRFVHTRHGLNNLIPLRSPPSGLSQACRRGRYYSASSTPAMTTTTEPTADEDVPKLQIAFTCTASDCDQTRSTHTFSKQAYESGVVLVQCPGCKNRHLIADHLGWFTDATSGGKYPTIEDMLQQSGEGTVERGFLDPVNGQYVKVAMGEGDVEIAPLQKVKPEDL